MSTNTTPSAGPAERSATTYKYPWDWNAWNHDHAAPRTIRENQLRNNPPAGSPLEALLAEEKRLRLSDADADRADTLKAIVSGQRALSTARQEIHDLDARQDLPPAPPRRLFRRAVDPHAELRATHATARGLLVDEMRSHERRIDDLKSEIGMGDDADPQAEHHAYLRADKAHAGAERAVDAEVDRILEDEGYEPPHDRHRDRDRDRDRGVGLER